MDQENEIYGEKLRQALEKRFDESYVTLRRPRLQVPVRVSSGTNLGYSTLSAREQKTKALQPRTDLINFPVNLKSGRTQTTNLNDSKDIMQRERINSQESFQAQPSDSKVTMRRGRISPQESFQAPTSPVTKISLTNDPVKVAVEEKSHVERLQEKAKTLSSSRKRGRGGRVKDEKSGTPWTEKHRPTSLDNHFVNPKKVLEVKNWMKAAIHSKGSKLAVIRGPSGSGKTATVHLVAQSLDLEVVEWTVPSENIGVAFEEFILKGSTYNRLPMVGVKRGGGRVLVVEDFPNFPGKTKMIGGVLESYSATAAFPLVFLLSEEGEDGRAFGKRSLALHSIPDFGFRPVATTFMLRFLKTVCQAEDLTEFIPSLSEIMETSNGDLRYALNSLQMKSKGITSATFRSTTKSGKTKEVDKWNGGREDGLMLFRTLGKILYAKQTNDGRLLEDPIALQERIRTPPSTLMSFLHGNYDQFFGSIEDASEAAGHLATADLFLNNWHSGEEIGQTKSTREDLTLTCCVLGMMSANKNPVSKGFRPFKKSLEAQCRATVAEALSQSKILQDTRLWDSTVPDDEVYYNPDHLFYLEYLPFLWKITKKPNIKPFCTFSSTKTAEDFRQGDWVSDEENEEAVEEVPVLKEVGVEEIDEEPQDVVEDESLNEPNQ